MMIIQFALTTPCGALIPAPVIHRGGGGTGTPPQSFGPQEFSKIGVLMSNSKVLVKNTA